MSGFSRVEWEFDEDHRVMLPRFIGDSEVKNISMSLSAIEITLENGGSFTNSSADILVNQSTIKMVLVQPSFFSFWSNHLQNVIDSIHIHEGQNPLKERFLPFFSKGLEFDFAALTYRYAVIFNPITGGDVLAACNDIEFLEARRGRWTV
ncbi:hypothetical protein [Aestuariivirga sp.]|uniref:hypothetical protein n=1 Tax=Aestuariivirga sp. TaxID=2650926 RepID=UPI0039E36E19